MFGFLKDKLKGIFKKVEKEEKEIVEPVKEEIIEKKEVTEVKEEKIEEEKPVEKKGFFKKLKEKIVSKKISSEKFDKLFEELELILMENNVAIEVIDKIKNDLKEKLVEKPLSGKLVEIIKKSLKESIEELFDVGEIDLIEEVKRKKEKPYVIMFVGVNGSGKTTTIAKIAHLLKENKLKCILVAADSFRASAIEQLEEWSKKLNIKIIKHNYGSDPAAVAFDGIAFGKKHNIDAVLIDTAGRQHSNINLIEQMKKIVRVAKPDFKIFVGESIVGNDCILQGQQFNDSINIDGIVLTKSDVDEKGGAAISISYITRKPILYLGNGQTLESLEKFNKKNIIESLGLDIK